MANIEMRNGKGNKKNKPEKRILRVDFTPMVDMNMLLITFFMFCTTLSMPQIMDIAMPSDKPVPKGFEPPEVPESHTVTAILGEDNKVYYYHGKPDYNDYTSLKVTDTKGFREVLIAKNNHVMTKVRNLKAQLAAKQISETDFRAQVSDIKKSDEGAIVLIKPSAASCYKNLVDVLDEMQICNISKYAIVDLAEGDNFLIDNFKKKGNLTAQAE